MTGPRVHVRLAEAAFEPAAELLAIENDPDVGAVVSFTGRVRGDAGVTGLTLEHMPGRTERALRAVAAHAAERWDLHAARIIHRVGAMAVGEAIVFVAAGCAHRDAAFAAARFMIDVLKTEAPFWKKETGPEGDRWVEPKTADKTATRAWLEDGR